MVWVSAMLTLSGLLYAGNGLPNVSSSEESDDINSRTTFFLLGCLGKDRRLFFFGAADLLADFAGCI